MSRLALRARDTLAKNRHDAIALSQGAGLQRTRAILQEAARDLERRIRAYVPTRPSEPTFSMMQMRTTLAQLNTVMRTVEAEIATNIKDTAAIAAQHAAQHTIDYLRAADKAFRGIGTQPLAIRQATMMEASVQGVHSSVLHRLAASPDRPGHKGVMQRYGHQTILHFEKEMQKGLLARKSWTEMQRDITQKSPFLQAAPAYWAARIVRTEAMHAYNRAGWESIREADEQLDDMVKILSATFDDRTASDSYAIHGQIRRPEEAFESWFGLYQHPPNRPNDREIVVPHRISWEIPEYLEWCEEDEIEEAWERERHKVEMPERPEMTTVDLDSFGRMPGRKHLNELPPDVDADEDG